MIADEAQRIRPFPLAGSILQYGPDKIVEVLHIDLFVKPDLRAKRLEGICTTTVCALDESVEQLTLDAVDLQVFEVTAEGRALRFRRSGDELTIYFDPPLEAEATTTFSVRYAVERPRHGLFFVDADPQHPQRVPQAWTQSQDQNARYWFPCLDYPHEKQTTSATIVVPRGEFAISNGALVERKDDGEETIFRYRQDLPHPTYLVTLVSGPFVEKRQRDNVFYYVLPGREADGERSFGKTPKMLDIFEQRLAFAYPYARYSQIAVQEFIFGGMENTTATTQTDRTLHDERAHLDFSSDPLVAHELAHQWFGDLLTCRDWAHAWLNEGFATFFEAVFREADRGADEYLYDIFECIQRYLTEDAERYRRPIVCNRFRDPIELFDRHLYEKAAAVLHMLRGELGERRFWRAMQAYVRDNAHRNVETIDLIRAIEYATGRNMRGFFDQWVYRGGHPKLKVAAQFDAVRRIATIKIEQTQAIDPDNPPFAFDVSLVLVGAAGEQEVRAHVERAYETVSVPWDFDLQRVRFDPGAFILADVTYDFGSSMAADILTNDGDPIARIRAARQLAKDGSVEARSALEHSLRNERFWGVCAEICAALGKTHAAWARDMLLAVLAHEHPKVRRAAAAALGDFCGSGVAQMLIERAQTDTSYFVCAAAWHALGKTRESAAFDALSAALEVRSWNSTIEAGAARGLGELADARATSLLLRACDARNEEGLRRAALAGLAMQGEKLFSERQAAVDAIGAALDDPAFMVQLAATEAAKSLADTRFLSSLDRLAEDAFDGRIRRAAAEAAIHIRSSAAVPAQVTGLRTDLDALREEQRKLQEKIEALSRA